jgi:hypothetical protein
MQSPTTAHPVANYRTQLPTIAPDCQLQHCP